jgi:hypothetical protein
MLQRPKIILQTNSQGAFQSKKDLKFEKLDNFGIKALINYWNVYLSDGLS